jgi:hypothetical protein
MKKIPNRFDAAMSLSKNGLVGQREAYRKADMVANYLLGACDAVDVVRDLTREHFSAMNALPAKVDKEVTR